VVVVAFLFQITPEDPLVLGSLGWVPGPQVVFIGISHENFQSAVVPHKMYGDTC